MVRKKSFTWASAAPPVLVNERTGDPATYVDTLVGRGHYGFAGRKQPATLVSGKGR